MCVFYLRLCVDVGAVGDELLHHVRLAGEGSYVEGCVSFLIFKKIQEKERNVTHLNHFTVSAVHVDGAAERRRVCPTGLFHLSTLAVAAAAAF